MMRTIDQQEPAAAAPGELEAHHINPAQSRFVQVAALISCAVALLCCWFSGRPTALAAGVDSGSTAVALPVKSTALDRYVAATDTNFSYSLVNSAQTPMGNVYVLQLVSQAWLTTNEVDRPVWRHWLTIAVPSRVEHTTGLLFITGGNNDKGPPRSPDGNLARVAVETRSVVAELRNVPNQPLEFYRDGRRRVEDDLIAYTWDKFLRTGDERWPARLPMTKSAVRAMDAVTAFCASQPGGGVKVNRFVVAGGSKRGWTTWTTAAVDKRVVGIAPIVIDVLNIVPSMQHHYAAYGFWAPAINDYTEHNIMDWMGTPQFKALMEIEEPFEYRTRFTMPKLMLNSTGDQFFLPDSSQFYFDALPGEKYVRYIPNADHSLRNSDAWETLHAFYSSLLTGTPLPRFTWSLEKDGSIKVVAQDRPEEASLWQATNPKARDFRLDTFGPRWTSTTFDLSTGTGVAHVEAPAQGWTAFFVELKFSRPSGPPLKLTTQVRVVPDRVDHKFEPKRPLPAER